MDLAQSILQELITLQKKNEELARIIGKLEHESDIIIQQFEHKIEELQKDLKHEQDEKSRSARRYEAEARDLVETNDALIKEIAQVRETYETQIHQFRDEIQALKISLHNKDNEYQKFADIHTQKITLLQQELGSLKTSKEEIETELHSEIETLNANLCDLTHNLHEEQSQFNQTLERKEEEIRVVKETLRTVTLRLYETEDREKSREEKARSTIDHLNHTIRSERQIRARELQERDDQFRVLEESVLEAEGKNRILKEETDAAILHLKEANDESLLTLARLNEENARLSDDLSSLTRNHDLQVQTLTEKYTQEAASLHETIEVLTESIQSTKKDLNDEIQIHAHELAVARQELSDLHASFQHEQKILNDEAAVLHQQISFLESEELRLIHEGEKANSDIRSLSDALKEKETLIETERRAHADTIARLQQQIREAETAYQHELGKSQESLQDMILERDKALDAKLEREDYFRNEITTLHEEIAAVQDRSRMSEEELTGEISLRDTQIDEISTNNEALRIELERMRLRYLRLQETIRAEKDESVHALYREITELESQVAGKDTEISALTKKVLRLDAENTRLLQNLSQSAEGTGALVSPATQDPKDAASSATRSDLPVASGGDPRRREIFALAADLEDPGRAPQAAKKLAEMGNSIVDLLIPLLHTGSIQRRVWIAVVLYEINDNRATLPLMKLLETPKVHFRELIWEAKNQYRSHSRTSTHPVAASGIPSGSLWPDRDLF